MTIFSIICITALTATGSQTSLDSFDYQDTAAAQKAWHATGGLPVEMVDVGGQRVMKLDTNLAGDSQPRRACIDCKVNLDLEGVSEFTLRVATNQLLATEYVSLYLRSGAGWYGMSSGFRDKDWQTLHFSRSKTQVEGKPIGWNKINTIRIAFWRAGPQDAVFLFDELAAVSHEVVVIDAGQNAADTQTVAETVKKMEKLLDAAEIRFDRLDEKAVACGGLNGRSVAILPYNPQPSDATLAALEKFINSGGRLFACYSLPERLGELLGFKPTEWQRGKRPGHFAEIRFNGNIPGMPQSVTQASWNIKSAQPTGHNARVVARWYDDKGKPTGEPAMLVSDRGAFMTHIVMDDDPQGKQEMLLATLGQLTPVIWKQAYEMQLQKIEQIGHCCSFDELAEHIKANNTPGATDELKSALALLGDAKLAAQNKQFYKATVSVRKASQMLDHAYLCSQPSPKVEARGWWCHSGTGPYPGDWDRALRELSETGFNMIFPNMLWAGVADYPSDILPRSKTYEKHGDQIAQCLAAAKKYGIEVHVWKVNHNLSHRTPKKFVDELRRQGRLQMSVDGQPLNWLCPSHPENFKLEVDSIIEVVEKYDVDGLHFDYIRYPNDKHCFCNGCRKRFEAASGKKVADWPNDCFRGIRRDEYRIWRTEQITRIVAAVSKRAKKIRKDVKISAAVFNSYPSCRDTVGQDWVHWAKSGYVDFLCPMDYNASDIGFQTLIKNQHRLLDGCVPIYPGIGATATNISLSPARVVGQVYLSRKLNTGGFTIFNLSGKTSETFPQGFGLGAGKQKAIPPHFSGKP